MAIFVFVEPWFGHEVLSLPSAFVSGTKSEKPRFISCLGHVLKEFRSTPTIHLPIIVILLHATNANGSVQSTRAT
jgi:hypothetical protein